MSERQASGTRGALPWLITLTGLLVVLDQVAKATVRANLMPGDVIPLLDGFLRVTYTQNWRGFSWWVPALPPWAGSAFVALRILILLAALPVYLYHVHRRRRRRWAAVAFAGIVAGTGGNLLDDVLLAYTTDYIQLVGLPSANLADVYAYTGVAALVVEMGLVWRRARPRWRGLRRHLADGIRTWIDVARFVKSGFRAEK